MEESHWKIHSAPQLPNPPTVCDCECPSAESSQHTVIQFMGLTAGGGKTKLFIQCDMWQKREKPQEATQTELVIYISSWNSVQRRMILFYSSGLNRAHHQNEILNTVANTTIRGIASEIRSPVRHPLWPVSKVSEHVWNNCYISKYTSDRPEYAELGQYERILCSLEEMAKSTSKTVVYLRLFLCLHL